MITRHRGCKPHLYQDTHYGNQMRVVNKSRDYSSNKKVSCTVCGEVFTVGDILTTKKKK